MDAQKIAKLTSADIEKLVIERMIAKLQTIIDEEDRQLEQELLYGNGKESEPLGVLKANVRQLYPATIAEYKS